MPHRVMATVLGLALVSNAGHLPSLHVHAYFDHDHPEHHHGATVHEHDREPSRTSEAAESAVHLERCDPSRHTISFPSVSSTSPQAQALDAEFLNSGVAAPPPRPRHAVEITDVRVHGPPALTQTAPRAPPLHIPA